MAKINLSAEIDINFSEKQLNKYTQKFKALSTPLRFKIILILAQKGKICVCDLTNLLNISQSKLSYHLKILLESELINQDKDGTWAYYSLNKQAIKQLLSEECCQSIYQ